MFGTIFQITYFIVSCKNVFGTIFQITYFIVSCVLGMCVVYKNKMLTKLYHFIIFYLKREEREDS